MTVQFFSAKSFAVAFPIPDDAPVIGTPQPFVIEHQIFSLTPGGDFSVEKYRCTATRGTNGVTIVTRRP